MEGQAPTERHWLPQKGKRGHRTFRADHRTFRADHQTFLADHRTFLADYQTFQGDLRAYRADLQTYQADLQAYRADLQAYRADRRAYRAGLQACWGHPACREDRRECQDPPDPDQARGRGPYSAVAGGPCRILEDPSASSVVEAWHQMHRRSCQEGVPCP